MKSFIECPISFSLSIPKVGDKLKLIVHAHRLRRSYSDGMIQAFG